MLVWTCGGGGGDSYFTASSPSQSRPTIPAHIPSSSSPVYPICPNLAHSPALYLWDPTDTSEQTLPCSQSLKMAYPKGRSAATKRCRCPSGTSCAASRPRQDTPTGRATVALITTSIMGNQTGRAIVNIYDGP